MPPRAWACERRQDQRAGEMEDQIVRKLSLMFAVAAALLFPATTFAGQHHDMIDICGAIGRLRPPLGFRSCRICVFRHPELITGQTIKARHLCLMSNSTETGVTR